MDNTNFEQQFTQNIKSTSTPPVAPPSNDNGNGNKLPLIVAIVLGVVTILETIVLIVTLVNYFSFTEEDYGEEGVYEDITDNGKYKYDDEYNTIAITETCRNESGAHYDLKIDNTYQYSDSLSNLIDSGTYEVSRENLIILKSNNNQNKTLFYGVDILADGSNIYECIDTEADSEE